MNPATRSKQVPQNILNVEFKLFDFMTLKQFTVICVASAFSFLFFAVLEGPFKVLVPIIFVILGLVVAFAKFNDEPFASFVTYFILAVLSPQRRVWKKKPNASIDSINEIGTLLPKTSTNKRADSYNNLINSTPMIKQNEVVHSTIPTTSKVVLPEVSQPKPVEVVKSNPVHLQQEGPKQPVVQPSNYSFETQPQPIQPAFIKTENTPSQKLPEVADKVSDLKVYVEDLGGNPVNSQVVILQSMKGEPVEAKVSINGMVSFAIPTLDEDYFVIAAGSNDFEFERMKLSYSEILSPNIRHVLRAIKGLKEDKSVEVKQQVVEQPKEQIDFNSDHSVRALTSPVSNPDLHLPPEPKELPKTTQQMDVLDEATEVDSVDKNVPNTINGLVKDNFGHYLQGVIVAIKNEEQMIVRALSTNQLGQFFSHSPIYPGKYIIEFEKDGYKFETYAVEISNKIIAPRVFIANKIVKAEDSTISKTSGII